MTIAPFDLMLYAAAMAGLWAVPGPVWVALTARALSGGMRGAWPLAVGVALGDLIWPLCAILGLAWVLSVYGDALSMLRWVAAGVFIVMGVLLLRSPARVPGADSRMTRPGIWAGFSVGMAAVVANPKAILFYMGVLPGFFDLTRITLADIAAIVFLSFAVPLVGNLSLALFVDRVRRVMSSPEAIRRTNVVSGWLLIVVAVVIAFT